MANAASAQSSAVVASGAGACPRWPPRTRALLSQLERKIDFGWVRADLNFFAGMIEAEHIDLDDPAARRHSIKLERAIGVGNREQHPVPCVAFTAAPGIGCPSDLITPLWPQQTAANNTPAIRRFR